MGMHVLTRWLLTTCAEKGVLLTFRTEADHPGLFLIDALWEYKFFSPFHPKHPFIYILIISKSRSTFTLFLLTVLFASLGSIQGYVVGLSHWFRWLSLIYVGLGSRLVLCLFGACNHTGHFLEELLDIAASLS